MTSNQLKEVLADRIHLNVTERMTLLNPSPNSPDSSGVYIFADISRIDEYGNDLPKVLYVGESHSFEERVVEEHEKWECALDHKVTHICVLELKDSSKSERLRIEKDIRIEHKPECNKEQS